MKRLALCTLTLSLSCNPNTSTHPSRPVSSNTRTSTTSDTPNPNLAYRWIPAFKLAIVDGRYRYEQTEFGFNEGFYTAAKTNTPTYDSPTAIPSYERLRVRNYFDRFVAPALEELDLHTLAPIFTDNYFLIYPSSNRDQSLRSYGVIGCFLRSSISNGVRRDCSSSGPNFFFFNSNVSNLDIVRRMFIHEVLHDWWNQGLISPQRATFISDLNQLFTDQIPDSSVRLQFLSFYIRGYADYYDTVNPARDWELFIEHEGYPVLWEIGESTRLPKYYSNVFAPMINR